MKIWSGVDGFESAAAETCCAGGWFSVSAHVVRQPQFRSYLIAQHLFALFVELAELPNQIPTRVVPGTPDGGVLFTLPMVLLFLPARQTFLKGIDITGIKGYSRERRVSLTRRASTRRRST